MSYNVREDLTKRLYGSSIRFLLCRAAYRWFPEPILYPLQTPWYYIGQTLYDWGCWEYAKRNPMRMWMLAPRGMCRAHLLGEHAELHMLAGSLRKGISLQGYIDLGLVELHNIPSRHEELVAELQLRGYHHKSPIPALQYPFGGYVNWKRSQSDLHGRCSACFRRYQRVVLRKKPKIRFLRKV